MEQQDKLADARHALSLVLSFFPRVDSRISIVLGIDLAMLGFLAARAPRLELWEPRLLFAALPLFLLGASLWHLYHASFPQLDGGSGSLIFFREIANRTEATFLTAFKAQTGELQLDDTLAQTWRNASILSEKYRRLRSAFLCMALAIIPWLITLATFIAVVPKVAISGGTP